MSELLPILMYHEYFDHIKDHLQFIGNYYDTVHLSEVVTCFANSDQPFPKNTIAITFDDAYQDFYQDILPLLKKYNLKATLCVPVGFIADVEDERKGATWEHGPKKPLLLWKELKEIALTKTQDQESLIEIIPHSVQHEPLDKEIMKTNITNLRHEIGYSKEALVQKLDIPEPQFFCLPGGAGCGEPLVRQVLLENHFVGTLKADFKPGEDKPLNLFCIPRWDAQGKNNIEDLLTKAIHDAA